MKWLILYAAMGLAADGRTTVNCSVERWNPWLYGQHPHALRVGTAMAGEFSLNLALSVALKRHHHERLAHIPLAAEGTSHWVGAINNLRNCR